jgi:hypothetical protein
LESVHIERQRALSEREHVLDAEKRRLEEFASKLQRKDARLDEEIEKVSQSARNANQIQMEYRIKLEEIAERMEALQRLETDVISREQRLCKDEGLKVELSLELQQQAKEFQQREKVSNPKCA